MFLSVSGITLNIYGKFSTKNFFFNTCIKYNSLMVIDESEYNEFSEKQTF